MREEQESRSPRGDAGGGAREFEEPGSPPARGRKNHEEESTDARTEELPRQPPLVGDKRTFLDREQLEAKRERDAMRA